MSSQEKKEAAGTDNPELVWGQRNIGKLIGRSPRDVVRMFNELDSVGRKHPIGEMMWEDQYLKRMRGRSAKVLVIDARDYRRYVDAMKAGAPAPSPEGKSRSRGRRTRTTESANS